jgi:hypothetical protein
VRKQGGVRELARRIRERVTADDNSEEEISSTTPGDEVATSSARP